LKQAIELGSSANGFEPFFSNFPARLGFVSMVWVLPPGEFPIIPMTETELDQRLQPSQSILAERGKVSFEDGLEQGILFREQLDALRGWRERLSPKYRRAWSAGRLLLELVGAAGYAGYFSSMHTFMRVVSGSLMAGAWYAIYRVKGPTQP
jgi:hypothetical protein